MSNDAPGINFTCFTCRAEWTAGRWTWGCAECGGGAMEIPCGVCLGACGGAFERAAMDSNDSGLAHFLGRCRDPRPMTEQIERVQQASAVVRRVVPDVARLRRDLEPWSSDARWAAEPRGPQVLQVVRDALAEQGVVISPRALAGLVFAG